MWFLVLSVKFLELMFEVTYLCIFHQNMFILVYAHKISHRLSILNATSVRLLLKLLCHMLLVVVIFCLFGFFFLFVLVVVVFPVLCSCKEAFLSVLVQDNLKGNTQKWVLPLCFIQSLSTNKEKLNTSRYKQTNNNLLKTETAVGKNNSK